MTTFKVGFLVGSLAKGAILTLRAFASTPRAFSSPLIGPWAIRRLGGRLARRAGIKSQRLRRRPKRST